MSDYNVQGAKTVTTVADVRGSSDYIPTVLIYVSDKCSRCTSLVPKFEEMAKNHSSIQFLVCVEQNEGAEEIYNYLKEVWTGNHGDAWPTAYFFNGTKCIGVASGWEGMTGEGPEDMPAMVEGLRQQ